MFLRELKNFLFYLRSRKNRIDTVPYYLLLIFREALKIDFQDDPQRASREEIDVLIPTASKDFPLLSDVVSSLRKNINHSLNKIFIVAPQNKEIEIFCEQNKCSFVDETSILPYGKNEINYHVNGVDRSGWIMQQILKLSGDQIAEKENYFVLDADTIIVNKINLIENSKFIFFQNKEWNQPYFKTFERMFGYQTINKLSFTSHMMIFNKKLLKEMKSELEDKFKQPWDKVYLQMADPKELSCISDYDTYANWVLIHHPNQVKQKPLYNKGLSRSRLQSLTDLEKKYRSNYKTISFHSYIK